MIQVGIFYLFYHFRFRMLEFQLCRKRQGKQMLQSIMYLLQVFHTTDTDQETTVVWQEKKRANAESKIKIP